MPMPPVGGLAIDTWSIIRPVYVGCEMMDMVVTHASGFTRKRCLPPFAVSAVHADCSSKFCKPKSSVFACTIGRQLANCKNSAQNALEKSTFWDSKVKKISGEGAFYTHFPLLLFSFCQSHASRTSYGTLNVLKPMRLSADARETGESLRIRSHFAPLCSRSRRRNLQLWTENLKIKLRVFYFDLILSLSLIISNLKNNKKFIKSRKIKKSRDIDTLLIVVEENMSDCVYGVNVRL